ncbi:tetratricopeptide repeat protein [Anabaena cylindrica UHCC 0172]|uniref:tetratricopeptide repeat protein n=1 Tax=Anabaena cylindrica TaxID=1165 RepID=UPI002B1EA181|nr:tetratricopeptide repeat protein [Anabaena cylindrica]MEA5553246.1 tetratricopeptide repeat protein [Anabaena cylindrica UHCC 0172]
MRRGNYVAITGMGGLGKTELATQYATQYQDEYGGIIWFNARESRLAAEVLEFFSLQLGLEIPQERGGQLLNLQEQVAWCWLQYPQTDLPVLIVVDDLTDLAHLREIVPSLPRFRVLITTRLQNLDPNFIQQLLLDVLSPEKALELLQKQLGEKDKRVFKEPEAVTAICKSLEYLPLGMILVGGYLLNDPGLSLTEMLARLQKGKLAEAALQERETINKTQLGVKAAFNLTWETLDNQAQQLGAFLSLFSPQLIVWDLVVEIVKFEVENEEKQLIWTDEELKAAKLQLYQRNLLQLAESPEEAYKIHNLVRWFLQEQLAEYREMQPVLERTFINPMIALAQALSQSPTSEDIGNFQFIVSHWEALGQRLIDNIKEKTEIEANLPVSILTDEFIWVFVGLGIFYERKALYQLAEPWRKGCVKVYKALFTGNHPDIAASLNNLAYLYDSQGRYGEAKPLYIDALRMYKRLFTGDHADVASSLSNLGVLYHKQGKYSEAESLYIKALEMRKRLFTGDYPDIANSLNNLALLYKSQGKYIEAKLLYLEALEMRKRLFTGDHPDVAQSLNNLAVFYHEQMWYSTAEPLYIKALEMRKRLFIGDHPDVANSLNNLADLHKSQENYSEAKLLFLDALVMLERVLGVNHPHTITVRENLQLLQQQLTPRSAPKTLLRDPLAILALPFYRLWLLIKRIVIFCLRLFRH